MPSSVFGQNRPSNRINVGIIGWGMQGPSNAQAFLFEEDCQVVAACDLDRNHLQDAVDTINDHYDNTACKAFHDYRELLARDDIDAVMIAVPDHWHELVATEAARRKKDVYGEKPLARTIAEQQAIVKAVEDNKIIWQTGSWQRSVSSFHKAAEIVRNGLIGEVQRVEVGLPARNKEMTGSSPSFRPAKPPPELDYEMWIGPSQMQPYIEARIHRNWRWNYNTGGGQLMDWVGHHVDIAHWGLDFDRSGPSEIEGHGDFPPADAVWNTSPKYRIELKYPRQINMTIAGGYSDIRFGIKWIGTDGWVWLDRENFEASNPDWADYQNLPDSLRKVKLYESRNHQRNFLDCVKSRAKPRANADVACQSHIACHAANISLFLDRNLKYDPVKNEFLDDDAANRLRSEAFRDPWRV